MFNPICQLNQSASLLTSETCLRLILFAYPPTHRKSYPNLSECFTFINNNNQEDGHTCCGALLVLIPPHQTNSFNKSVTVTACRLWKQLNGTSRKTIIGNVVRFGKEIKKYDTAETLGVPWDCVIWCVNKHILFPFVLPLDGFFVVVFN